MWSRRFKGSITITRRSKLSNQLAKEVVKRKEAEWYSFRGQFMGITIRGLTVTHDKCNLEEETRFLVTNRHYYLRT